MTSLNEHLNNSITSTNNKKERVDESLILGSIVCAACVGYAAGPMLNNDFFKSIGSGLGGLFSGLGSLFGGFGKKDDKKDGKKDDKKDSKKDEEYDLKALLKKKPDDLTGKEKAFL